MKRYRLLLTGIFVIFSSAAYARQTCASTPSSASTQCSVPSEAASLPSIDTQLAVLTEKLNLSEEQQKKTRLILKDLHDVTERLMQDDRLTQEERLAKVRPKRYKANSEIRAFLSDDQKKKLDQYLQGPHREMHGSLTGTAQPHKP